MRTTHPFPTQCSILLQYTTRKTEKKEDVEVSLSLSFTHTASLPDAGSSSSSSFIGSWCASGAFPPPNKTQLYEEMTEKAMLLLLIRKQGAGDWDGAARERNEKGVVGGCFYMHRYRHTYLLMPFLYPIHVFLFLPFGLNKPNFHFALFSPVFPPFNHPFTFSLFSALSRMLVLLLMYSYTYVPTYIPTFDSGIDQSASKLPTFRKRGKKQKE